MKYWRRSSAQLCCIGVLALYSMASYAQQAEDSSWAGLWQADGSLFTLRVVSKENLLHVEAVDSMGMQWRNSAGRINGDSVSFDVQYQGVTATVLVKKAEKNIAIARPISCQPDYHLVCALVQNQQALFLKVDENP